MKNKQFLRDVEKAERPDVGNAIYQLVVFMNSIESRNVDYSVIEGFEKQYMHLVEFYNKVGDIDADLQQLILLKERHNDEGYKAQVKAMLKKLAEGYFYDMSDKPEGDLCLNLIVSLEVMGYDHPEFQKEYRGTKEDLKAIQALSKSVHTMLPPPKITLPRQEPDAELEEAKRILSTLIKQDPRLAAAWKLLDEKYRQAHAPGDNILDSLNKLDEGHNENVMPQKNKK